MMILYITNKNKNGGYKMAAQIKDLRELTGKCKGINSRGDARERLQAASKVLANTEPRTMAALTRFSIALGESKALRQVIKDELRAMGREKYGTGYDDFKATSVSEEDVDYLDKTGLESILDYLSAAAIVADSAVEARQDADIETKKLKETVAKLESDSKPMQKSLKDAKLNLKDINKASNKYDPYSRDDRDSDRRRDDRDYDIRDRDGDGRRRDRDDRRDSRRDDRRDDRDYDRRDDRDDRRRVKADDRDIAEATSRRENYGRRRDRDDRDDRRDSRRDDRDSRRNDRDDRDGRTPRERDRRDNYDSRRDDDGYSERSGKNYASDLLAGFHKVIYGTSR